MTPRKSARVHLPELDRTFDQIKATFGASLEHLTTPDGTWGTDPTAGWPRVNGVDLRRPWTPPKPRGRS